jgi:maltose alpha-D-glucosyltransferase/alpha-amylase
MMPYDDQPNGGSQERMAPDQRAEMPVDPRRAVQAIEQSGALPGIVTATTLPASTAPSIQPLDDRPNWFKRAIFYELLVRAFQDGNDDGIGDFPGLISRLDYLQWLGVTCIWLLPFNQSPLRDGGYDVSGYFDVLPEYGTVQDVRRFLDEAHRRGMRVIMDLVMNHTSDQHPWFQDARSSPKSAHRDWYVWSETTTRYQDARIIFLDTETSNWTWDEQAGAFFWHRFFSHQPDLNYDNPKVHKAMLDVFRYWLDMGMDGFRLDAVPYLYEREGTNGENLPETHAFLADLRSTIDREYPNRVLLCEANQWPEDVIDYFGTPERPECHMNFHFPLMPRLFMALRREQRAPITEILARTPPIPTGAQWGIFLRNHDELTLEMVTEDERVYMWGEFAPDPRMKLNLGIRRRLAPLLNNGRRETELFCALLLSLPGTPIIYYGDEIGMGDNIFCRTEMASVLPCSGPATATAALAGRTLLSSTCLRSWIRSMDIKPSMSRRSNATNPPCSTGCDSTSQCARHGRHSAKGSSRNFIPPTPRCSRSCACSIAMPCCASIVCRALRSPSSLIWVAGRGALRSRW